MTWKIPFFLLTALHSLGASTPNIVLFYADDLGYTDLACQGSKYYETPNLDRLAKEGMRFTQAYASAATCAACCRAAASSAVSSLQRAA